MRRVDVLAPSAAPSPAPRPRSSASPAFDQTTLASTTAAERGARSSREFAQDEAEALERYRRSTRDAVALSSATAVAALAPLLRAEEARRFVGPCPRAARDAEAFAPVGSEPRFAFRRVYETFAYYVQARLRARSLRATFRPPSTAPAPRRAAAPFEVARASPEPPRKTRRTNASDAARGSGAASTETDFAAMLRDFDGYMYGAKGAEPRRAGEARRTFRA